MEVINITQARTDLYKLVDQTADESKPLMIKGKRNNAMLVSEDDWNAINETLYLCSIPKMRESIIAGLEENIEDCSDNLPW